MDISPSRILTFVPPKAFKREETGKSKKAKAEVPLPKYCAYVGNANTTHNSVITMCSLLFKLIS